MRFLLPCSFLRLVFRKFPPFENKRDYVDLNSRKLSVLTFSIHLGSCMGEEGFVGAAKDDLPAFFFLIGCTQSLSF